MSYGDFHFHFPPLKHSFRLILHHFADTKNMKFDTRNYLKSKMKIMKRQKNVSLKLYPNILKKQARTDKIPMYLKLVFNKSKVETRLHSDYDITDISFWDKEFMQFRGDKYLETNKKLIQIRSNFNNYMLLHNHTLKHSLSDLVNILLERGNVSQESTVIGYCNYYITKRVEPSNKIGAGTKVNYKKAFTHFKKFLEKEKLSKIPIKEFKYRNAVDFEIYLGKDANNKPTSITANIQKIKKIFHEAMHEEIIDKDPFKGLKLIYHSKDKTPSLTINQVKQILDCKEISCNPRLTFYRDLFLFGCFTGLSVINMKCLTNSSISPLQNGRHKLDTSRIKTGELILQILPEPAVKIIEKYSTLIHSSNNIFPKFHESTFNKKLEVISAYAKINFKLTTKISRTTCNQILINVGGINQVYERAYMGWSNLADIRSVYTTLEDDILIRNTENIESYLFSNLGNDLIEKIECKN